MKNSVRSRKFSIVIHDVRQNAKAILTEKVNDLEPDWSLIAEEEYNHQEGSHIHLFIKYAQPKAKSVVLKYIQKLELGGRVQVDIGRGDFDQCKKYIVDPDKLKKLDDNITENAKKLSLLERFPEHAQVCPDCFRRYYDPPTLCSLGYPFYVGRCWQCDAKFLQKRFSQAIVSLPKHANEGPEN